MSGTDEPDFKSYAQWTLPILRALDALGGSATPMAVEDAVRGLLAEQLNDLQWARVLRGNYVRWARHGLKKAGLVGGENGRWDLTDAGREWMTMRKDEPNAITSQIAELSEAEAGSLSGPSETVDVTDFAGYEIPILRSLEAGAKLKADLFADLQTNFSSKMLPGRVGKTKRASCCHRLRSALPPRTRALRPTA
jgi:hypothetical protein